VIANFKGEHMRITRISYLLAFILSLFAKSAAWAFPGPTSPLDQLWAEVSLVVYADVVSVKKGDYGQDVVLLAIATLKGPSTEPGKQIEVKARGICPGPFVFRKGMKLIAFLSLNDDLGAYEPWGPDGCIEVDAQGFKKYAAALKELPEILEIAERNRRSARLLDWYVDRALDPTTRWHGAVGISRIMYFEREGYLPRLVTPEICDRLIKALVSESPPGKSSAAVVYALRSHPSPALDAYLLESLRQCHRPGWRELTRDAVDSLPDRLGIVLEPATQARYDEWFDLLAVVNKIEYGEDEVDQEILAREKSRLDILWGALSQEVYQQCKAAIERRK
jgi:hypothetical protein